MPLTKNVFRVSALLCTISVSGVFSVTTAGAAAPAAEFEYPELAVTPRASERLDMEAGKEADRKWTTHLPIQFSATTTTIAGILQLMDPNDDKNSTEAGFVGASVGAGWLVLTSLLANHYAPYASAQKEVAGMAKRSPREQLLRERIAEERLEAAATAARRLQWFSVAFNAGAAGFMAANANPDSVSMVAAGAAAVSAFVPLIFPYRWQQVARDQRNYKKKIYAPLATATVLPEPSTGALAPGLVLTFLF